MTIDWEQIRRVAKAPDDPAPDWPQNLKPISQDGLALLGIDEHDHLYWDGKPLEIRKRLDLTFGERVFAVFVSGIVMAATVMSAGATWRQAYVAAKTLKFEKAKHELAVRAGRQ